MGPGCWSGNIGTQGIPLHGEDCLPPRDDGKAAPEKELMAQSPGVCAREQS